MAGRYTGGYLDRSNGWRAVATLTSAKLHSSNASPWAATITLRLKSPLSGLDKTSEALHV
jgi:hypothetical protein